MNLSDATHRLPLPPNAKGETNFDKIRHQIKEFVGINETTSDSTQSATIQLFTLDEHITMVQSICQDVCSTKYEILSINQLFFDLKRIITQEVLATSSLMKSIDDATNQLNQETYMYLNTIACQVRVLLV